MNLPQEDVELFYKLFHHERQSYLSVRYADGYLNKEKIGNVNSAGEIVVEKRW